jgi:hypothetical protein
LIRREVKEPIARVHAFVRLTAGVQSNRPEDPVAQFAIGHGRRRDKEEGGTDPTEAHGHVRGLVGKGEGLAWMTALTVPFASPSAEWQI